MEASAGIQGSLTASVLATAAVGIGVALVLSVWVVSATTNAKDGASTDHVLRLDTTHPFLGDLRTFAANASRLHYWLTEQSVRFHGEPWRIRMPLGMKNLVVVTHPEAVEDVLIKQFDNFPRGEHRIQVIEDVLGRSVVTSDGAKWYHLRKIASRFFTANALRKCMMTSVQHGMSQVYEQIDKGVASNDAVNMLKLFQEFSLQVFSEAGLGLRPQFIGNTTGHPVEHSMDRSTMMVMRRLRLPMWYWKLERWLNIGPERELAAITRSLRQWLRSVVDESMEVAAKKQKAKQSDRDPDDDGIKSIVELFMEQSGEESGMQPQDLVDFILTFLVASRDTSSVALSWFFLMLAKHPDVEKRVRTELATMIETKGLSAEGFLTSDHVRQLFYLEATIKEVLRLYPSVPVIQKEALHDTLLCGKYAVKKGELVVIENYGMGRMPNVWGPDAAEFKPERWIDPQTGGLITVPTSKLNAFGSGPRICIGMKLAMVELRVATANLLSRYQFSLARPNDGEHVVAIELMLKDPLMMKATPVKRGSEPIQ